MELMAVMTRKAEQSEATRRALIRVARKLFATRGYAATPIEEIVQRTRVTRGALYHHFAGKQDLFRAVYEDLERELAEKITAAAETEERWERHLEVGCQAFLDACRDPAVQRIVALDAPSVLGWEAWHEIDAKYGLGLIISALEAAMEAGYIEEQPIEPLATLLLGALTEAGLAIARADDVDAARKELGASVARLLEGLKPAQARGPVER
jgi:AcrR family transcriptional regulator